MPRGIYVRTEEHKAKMSETMKKAWTHPETKEKRRMTDARPDVKKRKSAALKEAFARPEMKEKRRIANARPEVKARRSASQKIAQNRPEVRAKWSAANIGKKRSAATKAKISAALKGRTFSAATKAKISAALKGRTLSAARSKEIKATANRIDVKNRNTRNSLQARKRNGSLQMTKPEIQLENLLNQILPNQYKFVGHGDFVLAGKCPDFVSVNGEKKIIEMIGDNGTWYNAHTPEVLQERVKLFKTYGYETLLVYDYELDNIKKLKEKLMNFDNLPQV